MEPGCRVFLDDKRQSARFALPDFAFWLGRDPKVALLPISFKRHDRPRINSVEDCVAFWHDDPPIYPRGPSWRLVHWLRSPSPLEWFPSRSSCTPRLPPRQASRSTCCTAPADRGSNNSTCAP